jgi:hypothetical protein
MFSSRHSYLICCICFTMMHCFVFSQIADTVLTDTAETKIKQVSLNGYVKLMPYLSIDNVTKTLQFNSVLQNRLNFRYRPANNLQFVFETRNRILSGKMVSQYSDVLVPAMEKDNGLIDASFVVFSNEDLILHNNWDRFYVDWQFNKWQFRLGRQRINWGINMVSNPNDLFNNYSFFDFDYEERPGADALRIQHYTGNLSRVELAVSPAKHIGQSVAAVLWAFNQWRYDFQFMAGYFHNRTAIGGGWAGNIKKSGFKGEMTFFSDIEQPDSMNVTAAICIDYLFSHGIYGFAEFLYNGGHKGTGNLLFLNEPMRADNIFISRYAATASLMYPVSPLFSVAISGMYMPDMKAFYFLPNFRYSALENLDISLLAQYFRFKENADLRQISVYVQVKWSF